ncbi:hypothetical protein KIN20_037373 [Parelaphostrongylus tenuis]|uniref:Uncharacterized protein n=1 Tax=Parelaphostrongylus tenuis TaxID=148309 RepID=A0AAD5RE61_PARTN|nr:hypothetical protein KIN20_037373 [Parelaphostrongylus tenuis]
MGKEPPRDYSKIYVILVQASQYAKMMEATMRLEKSTKKAVKTNENEYPPCYQEKQSAVYLVI